MRFTYSSVALIALALALGSAGCTVLVDAELSGHTGDAGSDFDAGQTDAGDLDSGPPIGACTGMANGIRCMPEGIVEPFVCVDQVCVLSTCGDGATDVRDGSMHAAEECDDGNDIPDDGCDPDCTFSCSADADCDDMELCNGAETCNLTTHQCASGTPAPDDTICTITGTATMAACTGGICRVGMCGDSHTDLGEECDDGNAVDTDGCRSDCTFTCESDTECQDTDPCNGNESCDVATHLCSAAAEPLDCDDMDPCTTDSCETGVGCMNATVLVDADGDGHPAITSTCGGDDCADSDPNRYPGAAEPCGSTADLNCDGVTGVTPTHYRDCDGDGYAASASGSVVACVEPPPPSGCTGGYVQLAPGAGTTDCLDTSSLARPNQTSFYSTTVTGLSPTYDYNCSGTATRQYDYASVTPRTFTECAFDSRRSCLGTSFYHVSSAPACGATTTLSYCMVRRPFLVDVCGRVETTTHRVACH